ncbi:MAG: ATP-dependent DNA ligase, partial [Candidatus Dormibacteraeota bacterium]|nr:ATP-dependent DNA ligase [Candidatus Dormibacteraeota bacterium]
MLQFAHTAESIGATRSKLEKSRLLGAYLSSLAPADLRLAAVWMTGRPFSINDSRTLQLGGASLWRAVSELTGRDQEELGSLYLKHSDPGDWAEEVLEGRTHPRPTSLQDVNAAFSEIEAASGNAAKLARLTSLLDRLESSAAKYVVKIMANDLRIGLQEGLVEEALASAFGLPVKTVQRVHMLTGDLGETAVRMQSGDAATAQIELFKPIRFMLAGAVADAAEAVQRMGAGAWTEEKYDGVRCQLHRVASRTSLYSRDLRETTASFPELAEAAAGLNHDLLIDGEVLAHRDGRVLRFFELQRRLGRKVVSAALRAEVPVVLVAFDLLYLDGQPLLDRPLRERRRLLEGLALEHPFLLARYETAATQSDLERIFGETRDRGNEGLMMKNPDSAYTPGRRGLSWLKLKRPLATLDCVVTAVEWGHGKRRGVLSDYTFAVRDEVNDRLVNVGKAFTGLTDAEIGFMTEHFLAKTVLDRGRVRLVEPETVVEVAFDSIQRSARHHSGFALRFPRIVRLRADKTARDIDTLASVE